MGRRGERASAEQLRPRRAERRQSCYCGIRKKLFRQTYIKLIWSHIIFKPVASAQFAGPATEYPGEQNEFHSTFGAHMQNTRNIYYNIIRERETWLTCQDQQSFDSGWETVWLLGRRLTMQL